ncbi:hypothetical protein SDC9_124387 [bioreactor metagenome]|uniref:Uncharacterized protein n=1 Tax=bioreactor metagenome TaxID=1076179 RepID=A0A645CKB7_9ZZZZ
MLKKGGIEVEPVAVSERPRNPFFKILGGVFVALFFTGLRLGVDAV